MTARRSRSGKSRRSPVAPAPHSPGRTFTADYAALDAPDRYLIGCGMDFGGWFRNLGGIYALPDDAQVEQ